jgi:hypothetical protein
MAIALRGSAWVPAGNPTTGFTCTIDANVVAGDYLIMCVQSRNAAVSATCTDNDTGGNTWDVITTGPSSRFWIWGKRATSGTAGKTITIANCVDSSCGVGKAFSGVSSGATPYANIVPEANVSTDESHASFTPTYRNCMVLAFVANRDDAAVTSLSFATLGATTMTEKVSTGGTDSAVAFGHVAQSDGPTATGALTWAQTDLATDSFTLVLIPNETLTATAPFVTVTAPTATLVEGGGAGNVTLVATAPVVTMTAPTATLSTGQDNDMADTTTKFVLYCATVYDAGVGATANTRTDLTTLVTKHIPTVRGHASVGGQVDDANTMYNLYTP